MKLGLLILVLGLGLSFVAAVVPHFSGAYQLAFGVLAAQLIPYLIYAPAAMRLDDQAVHIAGGVLVIVHGALVLVQRFIQGGDYSGPAMVAVPLLAAVLLLPLLVRVARMPWPTEERA